MSKVEPLNPPTKTHSKPKYQGKPEDAPFFVLTHKTNSKKEFEIFLDSLDFQNVVHGWKDKNGKPGITLVDRHNKKVGVCICHSEDLRDDAVNLAQKHAYMNGGDLG